MTSNPHEHDTEADEADLAEQRTPVADEGDEGGEEAQRVVSARDDVDEGDLLEQSTPVPEDDDDHRS